MFQKAVLLAGDNAHLHSFTGTGSSVKVNTGVIQTGHIGDKLKPGALLDVDMSVGVIQAKEHWVKGKVGNVEGFIRAKKVFPFNVSTDLSKDPKIWNEAKLKVGGNPAILFFDLNKFVYFDMPSIQYIRETQGLIGMHVGGNKNDAKVVQDYSGLKERQAAFTDEVRKLRQSFTYNAYDNVLGDSVLDKIAGALDKDPIGTLMANNRSGFLVCEGHKDQGSKKFLLNNLSKLQSAGVKTLYIEHFRYSDYQPLLDEYFASGDKAEMPADLAAFVKANDEQNQLSKAWPYNLKGLLEKLKKANVRFVAMDDSLTATDKSDKNFGYYRTMRMNFMTWKIIKEDQQKNPGKALLLVGAAHSQTHAGGVPGLSQMLKAPAVAFDETTGDPTGLVRENKDLRKDKPPLGG